MKILEPHVIPDKLYSGLQYMKKMIKRKKPKMNKKYKKKN